MKITTKQKNTEKHIFSGKRKTAVAKLRMEKGTGKIFFNHLAHTELTLFHSLALSEPLKIYERELEEPLNYDIFIKTSGGGKESQIQAARLAIARALVAITRSDILRKAFIAYDRNILVQDSRRKEQRKPGDSKARAKRQKSFR